MENKRENSGSYQADKERYRSMEYRRCGNSGIDLPAISLGLWHNFGGIDSYDNARSMARKAFDIGITHFDLANNYGPPYGSAELTFGRILKDDLMPYRDQLIISTKAGYDMWEGPYGNFGSRKYLISSLDQSLKRVGLEYVDIFYHHRPDPKTPMEETMGALDHAVRQGKALYAGISNYNADETARAVEIMNGLGTPLLIHQARYSMVDRWVEKGLTGTLKEKGVGLIAFSPLAQGILSDKYLNGIPDDSRAARPTAFLDARMIEPYLPAVKKLNAMAIERGQTLSQMAISWLLSKEDVTSVLIGVRTLNQLEEDYEATRNINFSKEENERINKILESINKQ
ncbi:MAG: L-glyceraldehyde 3-phosphate reductase [Bacteroidales bacterium]